MTSWQMISFPAWQNEHYVGLVEVLNQLGDYATDLTWSCSVEEMAPEPGAENLQQISRDDRIDSDTLRGLATPNLQVIDGEFDGYRAGTEEITIRIRAAGGDDWDVECGDLEILEIFVVRYPGVIGPERPEDIGTL